MITTITERKALEIGFRLKKAKKTQKVEPTYILISRAPKGLGWVFVYRFPYCSERYNFYAATLSQKEAFAAFNQHIRKILAEKLEKSK